MKTVLGSAPKNIERVQKIRMSLLTGKTSHHQKNRCAPGQTRTKSFHYSRARSLKWLDGIMAHHNAIGCNPCSAEISRKRPADSNNTIRGAQRPPIELVVKPHFGVGGGVTV